MAPEAEQGIVTPVSDIYMLGICVYEMLTGELPYGMQAGFEKIERHYVAPSERLKGLPEEADKLVYDALDPNPETRIPTPREFLRRLEDIPADTKDS